VIISESDTHFPKISLPPTPRVDSSYQYGPKPWIDQFPVFDSAIILVVGIIGLTFLTLMIVLLQFMIFGTRKKKRPDDEVDKTGGDDAGGRGSRGRGRGRGRRRKPAYRYGAERIDVYLDPRVWEGTGTDIEDVWFPLEGTGDGLEKKRVVWEDEEPDTLSYGKEAIFLMEEPRHAHC